jgi:hypothetical protein
MSTKTNLALDLSIFTAFLAVANPTLTGITIHEWLALAFAAAIITHLLLHWTWVVKVTREFFKKLFHQSRLNYAVDALFFIAVTGAIFSGLMISRSGMSTLGIQLNAGREWRTIHNLTANGSLVLLALHFALHWKWLVANLKRYVVAPLASLFPHRRPETLAAQPVRIDGSK